MRPRLFPNPASRLKGYFSRRMLTLLALGFASGLPAPLVFSNLSLWLRAEGVSRTDIGLFALAATPYAINFLWAPLIDRLRLPWLTDALGQRRAWILLSQLLLMPAILWMALTSPADHLFMMAVATLMVTTVSATQDIGVDAYRIDVLEADQLAAGSSVAIWGWHLGGTVIGGAGGLYLAHAYGWSVAYQVLALAVLIGIVATLLGPRPAVRVTAAISDEEARTRASFAQTMPPRRAAVMAWLHNAVIAPFAEFARRDAWVLILAFIFLFKFGDAMLGRMSGVFYQELGFELDEIADVAKLYGFAANMLGVMAGGLLAHRLGFLRALFVAGLLAAATNLTYSALAMVGQERWMLMIAVISDNFTGGLVTVAFVAYISSLCNVAYTATQYSLLSSLGNLSRIWLSASSGYLVDRLDGDWVLFFIITAALALIGLPLLWLLIRRFPLPADAAQPGAVSPRP